MGEAKKRGTREDRIAKAQQTVFTNKNPKSLTKKQIVRGLPYLERVDYLASKLTTHFEVDHRITEFLKKISDEQPILLKCSPEPWSRQSCCDLNVQEYIQQHGGRSLFGYKIWYHKDLYAECERHAVWTDEENIRDISFVDTGENYIIFVPDKHSFDDRPDIIRHAFEKDDKKALAFFEQIAKSSPPRKMLPDEAWRTMLTYERWLQGERMDNLIVTRK